MASILKVDTIQDQDGNNIINESADTITIGASGDTITIPSGATLSSTDPIVFPAGSAASPAITTTGDTDTGIFFAAANSLGFATGGVDRINLGSTGSLKVAKDGAAFNPNTTHQLIDGGSNTYTVMISNKAAVPASQYIIEVGFKSASPDNAAAKFFQMLDSTTARVNIDSDGDIYNHDGTYGTISDERIKQNIVDAGSQWNDIKNIRVRKYKKKHDVIQYGEENAPIEIGVISQELEAVSPGLIKEDKADKSHAELHEDFAGDNPQNVKYVKYSILYMKAIKALQEAMERIETLEAKVQTLENNNP